MKLAAVVPAAGLSRRMGREKVILPFGRSTVLETVLEALRAAGVSDIAAVVRADLPRAALLAKNAGALAVVNPNPEGEMLVSIRLGLGALPSGSDAVFVWPADHPAVSRATLDLLASLADPRRALLPTHLSRRGHPALVGRELLGGIPLIPPEEGLRHLWRTRAREVHEVAVDDPGVVQNIDTPEEYRKALERTAALFPSPAPSPRIDPVGLMERFARAIKDGSREPDPFLCRHLRTKTWYVADSYTSRDASRASSAAQYWCLKTMRPDGPDGALATPEGCTDERACFEPAHGRSES